MVRNMLTHATRLAAKTGAREPKAATPIHVRDAIRHLRETGKTDVAVGLILCWYTAQRPCDIVLLKQRHLQHNTDGTYVARFGEGKVIGRVEAYHIHFTVSDPETATFLNEWITKQTPHDGLLFPLPTRAARSSFLRSMTQALKVSDNALELKSLRRGTLQAYCRAGASENAMLAYSRHTTVDALRRYLGWGAIPTSEHQELIERSDALTVVGGGAPTSVQPAEWIIVDDRGGIELSTEHPPPPVSSAIDRSGYNLLAKPQTVRPVNVIALNALAETCSDEVKLYYREAAKWRDDATRYNHVPKASPETSNIPQRLLNQAIAAQHTIPVPHQQKQLIQQSCKTFLVHEDNKCPPRSRMIVHPAHLNHFCSSTDWVHRIPGSTRRSARVGILEHQGCISLDFAGWYQQIPLSEQVSWFFCFRNNGKWFRYTRQPTGASWSTDVATAHTMVLTDGTHPDVTVSLCIDNVRFSGEKEAVVSAAWRFVQRCKIVDAEVNELDVYTATEDDVARLWSTEDDFFGEVADYTQSTIRCRQKHVQRLQEYETAALKPGATHATLFGCYAMMLYMAETLGHPLSTHLKLRLWFSRRARDIAKGRSAWDEPPTHRVPQADIRNWVSELTRNRPGTLKRAPAVTVVVHIDACKEGYAAVVVPREESPYLIQHKWSAAERAALRTERSTNSEPEAIARVSEELQRRGTRGSHLFVSDHEQFAGAVAKGCSLSAANNSRLQRLAPWTRVVYEPGSQSLADPYSRFTKHFLTKADATEAIFRARKYAKACRSGTTYGVVGEGRSIPARVFHIPHINGKI